MRRGRMRKRRKGGNYEVDALTRVLDYPSSSGDGDDDCFFLRFFALGKGGGTATSGLLIFFDRSPTQGIARNKSTEKTKYLRKKIRPNVSCAVKGPGRHKRLYSWNRGSMRWATIHHARRARCTCSTVESTLILKMNVKWMTTEQNRRSVFFGFVDPVLR